MDLLGNLGLVLFGAVVGTYGTLVGAGGGFLIVPMMLLVYGATPQQAVGTSLAVVFLNAISGTVSYARRRRIDYRTGILFALLTLPGAVLGAYLTTYFTGRIFEVVFGIILLAIAGVLLFRPEARRATSPKAAANPLPRGGYVKRTLVDASGEIFEYSFNPRGGGLLSFAVGFFSSIVGIGGGIIHVPALVYLFGFPAHIATATSLFILAISAGTGTASHLALQHVLLWPALLIGTGVVVGAQFGAAISPHIRGRWLMRLLSIALVIVGARLVLFALGA